MNKKILVISGFCLSIFIIIYFIIFDYALAIKENWSISIPYRSFYKETY